MKKFHFLLCAIFALCVYAEAKGKVPRGTSFAVMTPATFMSGFSNVNGRDNMGNRTVNTNPASQNNFGTPGSAGMMIPGQDQSVNDFSELLSGNIYPRAFSVTLTVTSTAGAGAVATPITVLNNDRYAAIDDNGSGAASILYAWQDGTVDGTTVSEILGGSRGNLGLICKGVALRIETAGAADPVGLAASNPAFLTYTLRGRNLPVEVNPSDDQTRADQDVSIEVMPVVANVTRFTQFEFTIPGDAVNDSQAQITWYFTTRYKR